MMATGQVLFNELIAKRAKWLSYWKQSHSAICNYDPYQEKGTYMHETPAYCIHMYMFEEVYCVQSWAPSVFFYF